MALRLLAAVALAVSGAMGAACSTDPADAAQAYVASGDRYLAQKKFKHAIIQYRNAVKQHPHSGDAHLRLARAYERDGDGTAAARAYMKAAELMPDDAGAQVKAGQLELLAGEFEAARARADRVLVRHRRHVDAQILRANALAGLNDLNAAVAQIQQAVHHNADRSDAFANLGALQLASGRLDEAERAFRRAVGLAPYSVPVRLATANFYWTTGRPAEAERHLADALESTGGHPDIDRALAYFYLSTDRASRAERHLLRAVRTANDDESRMALADYYDIVDRPTDALAVLETVAASNRDAADEAVARIAAIHTAEGRVAEAEQRLDARLRQRPASAAVQLARGRLLLARQRPDEALPFIRRALGTNPDSVEIRLWLARALAAKDALPEARSAYEELLAARPGLMAARTELAQVHLDAGDPRAALALTRRALETQPDAADVLVLHAEALHGTGEIAAARAALRDAASRRPDSASLQARLGSAYVAIGDPVRARAAYTRALRLDPGNALVANNLAWLLAAAGRDLDEALALARRAHAVLHDRPEVGDTLGWIYHLKGETASALPLLHAAVERRPDNPRYQLHLGLAAAEAGEAGVACDALSTALGLDDGVEGAEEARLAVDRLEGCGPGAPVATAGARGSR
jgi:tetratricopeptide (TPR) repeat protein